MHLYHKNKLKPTFNDTFYINNITQKSTFNQINNTTTKQVYNTTKDRKYILNDLSEK